MKTLYGKGFGVGMWKLSVKWGIVQGWDYWDNMHWSVSCCSSEDAGTFTVEGL